MLLGGETMLNAPKKVRIINRHAVALNSAHQTPKWNWGLQDDIKEPVFGGGNEMLSC